MAGRTTVFLAISLVLLASTSSAAVVEHTFNVAERSIQRLCRNQVITAVNSELPGPTINVNEGDTLIVHVKNNSPHNMTIHWHGIFHLQSQWADGPSYITQCPILPKHSYTYKFTVTGQEGTLWWHAHVSLLRATVYGALVIRPRKGQTYPFPIPYKEVPILFGEWWNADVVTIDNQGQFLGIGPNMSDAFTINGQPGDLYQCSSNNTFKLNVVPGKSYLLRIINSAVNNQIFFKLSGHRFTVVGIDATYTKPYDTDVIVTGPGQTIDALFTANQPIGDYYMTTRPYVTPPFPFNNGSATGIVHYIGGKTSSTPLSPVLPAFNDTPIAHKFYSNLTSLTNVPSWVANQKVKHKMFIAFGFGLADCGTNANCSLNTFGSQFRIAASMNNVSFQAPSKLSLLEAFHFRVKGIYTRDFPNQPLTKFDYTNSSLSGNVPFMFTTKQTRLKRLKFNDTVEIVLQNTAFITTENHPIHLHGFNFYVLAQGFGNFKRNIHSKQFNVVDPQERNTIAVPVGGWAVIRFRANNPGIWFMHCHLDTHLPFGLGTAFEVGNGPTPSTTLPPPPHDLPKC